jgi:hypothetical protein
MIRHLLLFFMRFMIFVTSINAEGQNVLYKQSPFNKRKINVIDSSSNKIGYYRFDKCDESKINVYDVRGNLIITVTCDEWNTNKNAFYDSICKTRYDNRLEAIKYKSVEIRDRKGLVVGYYKLDIYDNTKVNVYDRNGKKCGYFRKNESTDECNFISIRWAKF